MALGAIIGSAIAGLAGSALNTGVQSGINAAMTDWQMRYNAEQAQLNRDFQSQMLEGVQDFNSAEAQKQRDWETQMSNTAHQREMADLEAAGLNPILAANSGANSSLGATASVGQGPAGSMAQSSGYSGAYSSISRTFDSLMQLYENMNTSAQKAHFNNEMLEFKYDELRHKYGYYDSKVRVKGIGD